MVLNLIALIVLAAAPAAALVLMRRYLPAAGVTRDPVCLRCGQPAAALESFTCPGCGHDVRELGLGRVRGATPLGTFWLLVAFTCAYLVAAPVLITVALNAAPRAYRTSRDVSMRVSSPQVHAVDLYLEAEGPDERRAAGRMTGELYAAGGIVLLEVDVPSLRWRLLDWSGKPLESGERLDGKAVYRWMDLAGVPTDSAVAHSDAAHIANHVGQIARTRLEMPPVPGTGKALALSYSSTSGGGSSSEVDPRRRPALVIAAAVVWLAGVWLVLLWRRRGSRTAATPLPGPPREVAA